MNTDAGHSTTHKRGEWVEERIGQAIALGIVGYYVTWYVTDFKSLAILVAVGFVLVGWELENEVPKKIREEPENLSCALRLPRCPTTTLLPSNFRKAFGLNH